MERGFLIPHCVARFSVIMRSDSDVIISNYEVLSIVIARSDSDEAIRKNELERNSNVWIATSDSVFLAMTG